MEEKLNNRQASSSITSTVAVPDYSLDAVVERLGKQRVGAVGCVCCMSLRAMACQHVSHHDISRITLCIIVGRSDLQPCRDPSVSGCFSPQDEILNDTQELQKELKLLKKDYEKASQQRIFVRQEQQDVAEVIVFGIWQSILLVCMEIPLLLQKNGQEGTLLCSTNKE